MPRNAPRRRTRRFVASVAAAVAVTSLTGGAASAAPLPTDAPAPGISKAMANGVNVRLLGTDQLIPTVQANNDGTIHPFATNPANAIVADLPDAISVGVVGQVTYAYPRDTTFHPAAHPNNLLVSAACSGLIAENSLIEIGNTGDCSSTTSPSDGIRLDLGGIGLRAGAAYSSCTVDNQGYWTGDSTLASVRLVTPAIPPFIPEVTLFEVPIDPDRNFGIDLGIAQVMMNKATIIGGAQDGNLITDSNLPLPADADGVMVEALDVTVGGALGVETGFRVGQSVCYKSIAAAPPQIPLVPKQGVPVAASTAAGLLGLAALGYRRRATAATR
ncbi:hypothetical protein KSP35_16490 [Aquihabitans sp. G128]|uniref:hypothetical protein n=1 Tax=Aquihabitans sp. G128 TaxID=2849779 RepID=UPI001C2151C5|nr:hypothetical protein [Aquihabitans sp. G128]QXC59956.1 hypothetical protein KSP35_16490 [Aquihabitans sp. G128]